MLESIRLDPSDCYRFWGTREQGLTRTRWQLTVERVQTIFQCSEDTQCAHAVLLPNGDMSLDFHVGNHWASRHKMLISHHRGRTWEEPEPGAMIFIGFVRRLADWTVMSLEGVKWGEGRLRLKWSDDDGDTYQQKIVRVNKLPNGVNFYGPAGLVELTDGSLLCPYYGRRPGEAKYHTGLVGSMDCGNT